MPILGGPREKLEYSQNGPPGMSYRDSTDLEAATKTITATAEASGVGNADYSAVLTGITFSDSRLIIKRLCSRLAVTIDSFDTATHLYCRVYVDAQDADHRLFDLDWTTTGQKLSAVDMHSGALATLFNALKTGGNHTFYFFFWVDQANNAVISEARIWFAIGSCSVSTWTEIVQINHYGPIAFVSRVEKIGSGTPNLTYAQENGDWMYSSTTGLTVGNVLNYARSLWMNGTVATDLNCIRSLQITFRSES